MTRHRSITVRDLLTHSAGISYGGEPHIAALYEAKGLGPAAGYGWYTADKDEPTCTTMERLASLPFVAQPGEAWGYGYSTDILGCVVERVSGASLGPTLPYLPIRRGTLDVMRWAARQPRRERDDRHDMLRVRIPLAGRREPRPWLRHVVAGCHVLARVPGRRGLHPRGAMQH